MDGQEAIERTIELKPDLVLVDISMPVLNGLQAVKKMHELQLPTRIVIFSMHDSAEIARQAKEVGADACLVKTCSSEELLATVGSLLQTLSYPPVERC